MGFIGTNLMDYRWVGDKDTTRSQGGALTAIKKISMATRYQTYFVVRVLMAIIGPLMEKVTAHACAVTKSHSIQMLDLLVMMECTQVDYPRCPK